MYVLVALMMRVVASVVVVGCVVVCVCVVVDVDVGSVVVARDIVWLPYLYSLKTLHFRSTSQTSQQGCFIKCLTPQGMTICLRKNTF